ncbi:hypothetical protein QBC37DRAFT_205184 [Rhypophila decipiens]|uniref:Secreted protein n=1 Tax=Rhypophila decipiens TaxID=261697 RepID=A0AAN6Y447_9PEZI|nr:hypothetical protein QBC37DRAFT_205184 [Rhypophila decipiens]
MIHVNFSVVVVVVLVKLSIASSLKQVLAAGSNTTCLLHARSFPSIRSQRQHSECTHFMNSLAFVSEHRCIDVRPSLSPHDGKITSVDLNRVDGFLLPSAVAIRG